MANLFLSITFSCGLIIAVAHVINSMFIAPIYDVVANLTAFASAVAASVLSRALDTGDALSSSVLLLAGAGSAHAHR
jgi:hypothetical protein